MGNGGEMEVKVLKEEFTESGCLYFQLADCLVRLNFKLLLNYLFTSAEGELIFFQTKPNL